MKDLRKRIRIAVIGGSRPGRQAMDAAFEVGRLIARAGAVVVCGGLGGVMEAASRGAREEGGLVVGILPGASPADANPWVDVPVATGLGYTRNALVVMNADAVIAVDGEYGTLSEIAYGKIHGKKVVGLGTWEVKGVEPAASPGEAVRRALEGLAG
ncbi:MAG TPA: TIGR00725 family protein [Candidatus Aminicenantes bacterium]|nr:TIGR00725 family protein [Candidatus Aminicenantes bacterium]HRY65064.1 TIGR00725 family protein [Candidatus Aminicenantes bacterium]HRZ71977.1 TIGR00725 family protein [Candidatus Aminicenantes bacterium]